MKLRFQRAAFGPPVFVGARLGQEKGRREQAPHRPSHGSRRGGFSRRNRGGEHRATRPCALHRAASTQVTSVLFPRRPPESRSGGRGGYRSLAPGRRGNPCWRMSGNRCRVEAWLLTQLMDLVKAALARRPRLSDAGSGRRGGASVICLWQSRAVRRYRHSAEHEKGRASPPGLSSFRDAGTIRPAGLPPWPSSESCRARARSG